MPKAHKGSKKGPMASKGAPTGKITAKGKLGKKSSGKKGRHGY